MFNLNSNSIGNVSNVCDNILGGVKNIVIINIFIMI